MFAVVVEPPSAIVLAQEAQLLVPTFRDDSEPRLDALLMAAQGALEPPSWLNAALGEQTLLCTMDGWPGERGARLPYGPAIEIVDIKFDDGAEQTVDPATYELVGAKSLGARLMLKAGQSWPGLPGGGKVRVTYKAGHEADDPKLAPAKLAVCYSAMKLRSLSERDLSLRSVEIPGVATRTWTISETASMLIRETVEDLLSSFRVWSV